LTLFEVFRLGHYGSKVLEEYNSLPTTQTKHRVPQTVETT